MQDGPHALDLQEMLDRGRAALKDARPEEALQCFTAVVARAPNDYTARTGMGAALMHLGRASEAVEHLKRAAAIRPDSAQASLNLARAYHALGEYFVAENLLRQVLQRDPTNATAQSVLETVVRDRAQAATPVPAAAATGPSSMTDCRAEAEALLVGGAQSARLQAQGARSMKAPLIGGAALAAIAVIYLIVYGGSHLGSHSKGWEHYRAPNGEFELDVP
jgi:tetratricopeptide (TPR) repeat protein